jgi:6-phosphogluconolactonase
MPFIRPAILIGMLAVVMLPVAAAPKNYLVYFGTYTGPKSKGIYVARFDASTGRLGPLNVAAEVANPSFVALHPSGRYLYAVSEDRQGSVSSFSIDPASGTLTFLNRVSSKGRGPCYVITDKTGKCALVANYGSGVFASMPIEPDGKLREAASVIQDEGKGSIPSRQEGPHAHSLNPSPDNRFAIGADLGLDKLFIFKLDPANATLTANDPPYAEVKPGSGPRHFAFHPNRRFAYVTNEIASTVTAFAWDGARGSLKELQTISTLPAGFSGENTTAQVLVHPSGKFLYDSNRGADTIAVFRIDRKGMLNLVDSTPTQGKVPRNFNIDPTGRYLIAANQNSDNIVVFRIDQKTGKLTPNGQTVEVGSPVCVQFLPVI